jgi:Fic family protein
VNVEIRERNGKKLYYLSHSFRVGEKTRKVRKYLGADLSKKEIEGLSKKFSQELIERAEDEKIIQDPYEGVLSEKDIKVLNGMVGKIDFKVTHLSEKDWQAFTEVFTYDTNAIEGSTFTLGEVKDLIENDKWPGGKSRAEISETYGVSDAIKHIRKTDRHISLKLIREIHMKVFKNSKTYAGRFREEGVEVAIKDAEGKIVHKGVKSEKIKGEIISLVKWYNKNMNKYHPIVLAAVVHNQFETIHPFQDGNGRVGRILMNNILIKNKLPPVNIELINRTHYYNSLQAYGKMQDIKPTITLLLKEYNRAKKYVTTK